MKKKNAIFFTFFPNILTTCSPDIGLPAVEGILREKWRIVPMGQKTEGWPYQMGIQTIINKNIEKNATKPYQLHCQTEYPLPPS